MDITVEKATSHKYIARAAGMTSGKESHQSMLDVCISEHSPLRTQMYWIEMLGIPTKSSVHLVRHKIWVEHFVKTNREDRGGAGDEMVNRATPVDHAMFISAQELLNMARVRLCRAAELHTRLIMQDIVKALLDVEPVLAFFMVPMCVYRNGFCGSPKPCGSWTGIKDKYSEYIQLFQKRQRYDYED